MKRVDSNDILILLLAPILTGVVSAWGGYITGFGTFIHALFYWSAGSCSVIFFKHRIKLSYIEGAYILLMWPLVWGYLIFVAVFKHPKGSLNYLFKGKPNG